MLGDVPDVFPSFKFQKGLSKNVGAVCVEISLLPGTSLMQHMQQYVATAQAVIILKTYSVTAFQFFIT